MYDGFAISIAPAAAGLYLLYRILIRLRLSLAKHPSLRGHARWSRRLARLVPSYGFHGHEFFRCDGAPEETAEKRQAGMTALLERARQRSPGSLALSARLEEGISDARFTSAYRVPFPFRDGVPWELRQGSIVEESRGTKVRDIDGNWRYDLSGSYGVNVLGYDFYKACLADAMEIAGALGPVLGAYHPVIEENVTCLRAVSGLDEISFHMSGTEAVMQAVRLARYHTGRSHLVRMCGAYHGWWDGVQPGIGNQRKSSDIYTLSDLSQRTLKVLESRTDIACVLINPLQALHPNCDAPGDATLLGSQRSARFDRPSYTEWLQQLRHVCTRRGIVLIFDEVFTGFRLAWGGAQEYFDVKADMVTYGKTLGGGLPVGVLCGKHHLMKRFKQDEPANISFARGTFNSHPHVMAAMNAFLRRAREPGCQEYYREGDALWDGRAQRLNHALEQAELPVRVANMHSIWTVLYTLPCRYNWMFQFYLRDQDLELSWVGSGRLILSLNYTEEDFSEVMGNFLKAARQMAADGWWWDTPALTHRDIRRQLLREMLGARLGWLPQRNATGQRRQARTESIETATGKTP